MSELTKALIGFHKAVDKIDKNARGNYGKFADLANVLSTVTPALHANNLAVSQTFDDDSLVTTLHHTSGETIHSSCKLHVADGRSVTQEWGKAVTYQRRYMLCCILGIVADMDTDAEPSAPTKGSSAYMSGYKAINAAKNSVQLADLSKRVQERYDKKDLNEDEYKQLIAQLMNKERELIP